MIKFNFDKINYLTYSLIFFDLLVFSFFYVSYLLGVVNYEYVTYAVIVYLLGASVVLKVYFSGMGYISLFFLFNITFFLFLFGRFVSYVWFQDYNPFELDFMATYEPSKSNELLFFIYLIGFLIFSNIGYFLFGFKGCDVNTKKYLGQDFSMKIAFILSCIVFSLILVENFLLLKNIAVNGYLSRYADQSGVAEVGRGWLYLSFISFCALTIAFSKKCTAILPMIVFIILNVYGIISVLGGERGPFITILLTTLWVIFYRRRASFLLFFIWGALIFLLMTLLLSFSARQTTIAEEVSLLDYIFIFIKQQGITMPIIGYAIFEIDKYPFFAYFSSFFPIGSLRIYQIFGGGEHYLYELSFGAYTAWTLNSNMYLSGFGTGFSIIGSLYIFSGGGVGIFLLMSFFFGMFIKILNDLSRTSSYWFGLSISISPALFFVARAEVKNIIQVAAFYTLFFLLLKCTVIFLRVTKK